MHIDMIISSLRPHHRSCVINSKYLSAKTFARQITVQKYLIIVVLHDTVAPGFLQFRRWDRFCKVSPLPWSWITVAICMCTRAILKSEKYTQKEGGSLSSWSVEIFYAYGPLDCKPLDGLVNDGHTGVAATDGHEGGKHAPHPGFRIVDFDRGEV